MKLSLIPAIVAACVAAIPMDAPATPPVQAAAATPLVAPEIVRADFALLYTTLQEAHFDLYARRSKPEYDRFYRELSGAIREPMTAAAVAAMFQKFVAYGRIGHARIDAPIAAFVSYLQTGGTVLPLFIRVERGKVVLTRTTKGSTLLPAGTQIVAIDGEPIERVIERLGQYVSAERPYMTHAQMEESFPALLWIDRGPVASVEVTATVAGKRLKVSVPAVTLAERRALVTKYANDTAAVPFATRDYRALDAGIAYLRPGPFFEAAPPAAGQAPSYQTASFRAFVDDSFGKMLASGTRDLILDLRNNPGGDNSFSDPMIAWFATRPFRFAATFDLKASAATKADYARRRESGEPIDPDFARQMDAEARAASGTRYRYELPLVQPRDAPRFGGRVWVLVNRHSYSNATSVAALIQDYGFGKIVGEETADVPSSYASVQSFTLPGTKIAVTYPKSHFVRPNGKDDGAGVIPDFPIAISPIGSAEDLVLTEALAIVRKQRPTEG